MKRRKAFKRRGASERSGCKERETTRSGAERKTRERRGADTVRKCECNEKAAEFCGFCGRFLQMISPLTDDIIHPLADVK